MINHNNKETLFIKIVILGDSGVGKTSMLNQFCYSKFDAVAMPTIGSDFSTKIIDLDNKILRLQLWDIAGQDRFRSVSKLYIRGSLGCVIVAEALNDKSLENANEWKKLVIENSDDEIPIILLYNKSDLIEKEEKLKEENDKINNFSKNYNFNKAFLTSAKNSSNLNEAFHYLCEEIIKNQTKIKGEGGDENFSSVITKNDNVKLTNFNNSQKKKECC